MKLNVEDLALQADPTCSGSLIGPTAVRTFARLIVERCAVECEKRGSTFHSESPFSVECNGLAASIRNLLEDK